MKSFFLKLFKDYPAITVVLLLPIFYYPIEYYYGPFESTSPDKKEKLADAIMSVLNGVNERIDESKAEHRANPNNQFESLEECLASDNEINFNMSRAKYCESDYVLLKN